MAGFGEAGAYAGADHGGVVGDETGYEPSGESRVSIGGLVGRGDVVLRGVKEGRSWGGRIREHEGE